MIRLSGLFLLELLVKYCSQLTKRPFLRRAILKFGTIKYFRELNNSVTLFGSISPFRRLLFNAVSEVEHFNVRIVIVVIAIPPASLIKH